MDNDLKVNVDRTLSQMRKGFLEFCILLIISKGEAYASDIIEQLKNVELIVVEGTLYPLLTRLKNDGLLNYSWSESQSGPPRKYYSLTEKGKLYLEELERHWDKLNKSIESLIKQS